MFKSHILFFLLFFFSLANTYAQFYGESEIYKGYTWTENPIIQDIDSSELSYPAVVIIDNKIIEQELQSGSPVSYITRHKLVHVNNDAGIEKFNKIYIPLRNNRKLIALQVRAISPSGKITNIQQDNIKELENVEGIANVKIFAIEGLEVGGEAEYLYTLKGDFEPFGREIFQEDVPIRYKQLKLVYPSMWNFKTKSYNGLQEAEYNNENRNRDVTSISARSIPAAIEEEYSAHKADLMKIDYKIVSNGYKRSLFSWRYIAERLVNNLSIKKGHKAGRRFVKDLDLELNKLKTSEKILALESKIKSTIAIEEGANSVYADPKEVVSNGVGNERGLLRLYIYCLEEMNIQSELVFCTNRFNGRIDPDFANVTDISTALIYIPSIEKYLVPNARHMRLGPAPQNIAGTTGLFTSYEANGYELELIRSHFDQIKPLGPNYNHVGVRAKIDFTKSMTLPPIQQENYQQGYRAFTYRSFYHYGNENQRKELIKQTVLSSFDDYAIKKQNIEGTHPDLSADYDKYFRIHVNYTTPELVEKAGPDYLVAVGKIIGRQSELYQETERRTDIAFHAISNYNHEIVLIKPDGYQFEGLENIRINNRLKVDGEDVMLFISDYKEEEDRLIITIHEVYKVLSLPVDRYNDFRRVVNSAADFNKLTLVLSPE